MLKTHTIPRVLVVGATGLLGSQIALELTHTLGTDHVVLASRKSPAVANTAQQWVAMDIADDELKVLPSIDILVHAAGEKSDVTQMVAINHSGTCRLVEAAARSRVRRFVYISSVGVYGAPAHSGLIDESFVHRPRNAYEASKAAGEQCVREVCQQFSMECVIVQPSNIISPLSLRSLPLLAFLSAIKSGKFTWFGDGDPWVNYVSVEDTAAAVAEAALCGPADRTFIVNTPHRLEDFVTWGAQRIGVPVPRRRFPLWAGQIAASAGNVAATFGRSLPFDTGRLLDLTNTTRYEGNGLHNATGFEYPVGLRETVTRLVDRYKSEGRL